MKTKLTLTVRKSVIETAKRRAKNKGISLSQMFEEIFEGDGENEIKSEAQKAAERLLKILEKAESTTTLNDKDLIKGHVARKFA